MCVWTDDAGPLDGMVRIWKMGWDGVQGVARDKRSMSHVW